jgi:hypothetical protein
MCRLIYAALLNSIFLEKDPSILHLTSQTNDFFSTIETLADSVDQLYLWTESNLKRTRSAD